VEALTFQERNTKLTPNEKSKNEEWSLRIENNVGILTLPTFSFWQSKFDWAKFLDESFAELDAKKIPNLIIDIRANEGGDGAISRAIMSHLLRRPFTWPATQPIVAYERAPYVLAKHLDTWDYSFFDRTGQVEKLGERRYLYKTKAAVDRNIKPVASPYFGKTFMLVSAENSSATFQLAYLAKLADTATLVGQATGGNLRGLNGGELAWVTLPNSGVAVDIPLVASVALEPQPDGGITPDIVVKKTFAARAAGEDLEMLAAKNAIRAR
jgi:C-terminal processing protease CtpA/Prc